MAKEEKPTIEKTPAKKTGKKNYFYAVGRRKTASARIRLYSGKGEIVVNGQPIEKYFPGKVTEALYTRPFRVTDSLGKYYATIKVVGSGKISQLKAVIHGLSRALDKVDRESFHSLLKKHGLLTRDPRMRERRKPGTGGRARRQKQSPKR